MPVVFYVLGLVFAAVAANFLYGAVTYRERLFDVAQLANFQMAHSTGLAIALGAGVISALFFATGAIIQTLRDRGDA